MRGGRGSRRVDKLTMNALWGSLRSPALPAEGLFLVVSLFAVLRPAEVHLLIVLLDEFGYPGYLAVAEDASVFISGISYAYVFDGFQE